MNVCGVLSHKQDIYITNLIQRLRDYGRRDRQEDFKSQMLERRGENQHLLEDLCTLWLSAQDQTRKFSMEEGGAQGSPQPYEKLLTVDSFMGSESRYPLRIMPVASKSLMTSHS